MDRGQGKNRRAVMFNRQVGAHIEAISDLSRQGLEGKKQDG